MKFSNTLMLVGSITIIFWCLMTQHQSDFLQEQVRKYEETHISIKQAIQVSETCKKSESVVFSFDVNLQRFVVTPFCSPKTLHNVEAREYGRLSQ